MRTSFSWLFITFVLVCGPALAAGKGIDIHESSRRRGNDVHRLDETILGALVYLDDTQIRNRPGRKSCVIDSADEGDGCKARIVVNPPFIPKELQIPSLAGKKVANRTGEWANFIHFFPKQCKGGKSAVLVQDSNPFVTAFVAYPLFFLEDDGANLLGPMLSLAMRNMSGFKRGQGYNFWPSIPDGESPYPGVRAPNIPISPVGKLAKALGSPRWNLLLKRLKKKMGRRLLAWVERCETDEANLAGAYAFFNIPNDADDTSVIVASQILNASAVPGAPAPDLDALRFVTSFRDLDRPAEDEKDAWKGKDSGAYLTWLRDERAPIFGNPADGVVPLAVNNVDAVVNANALFALSLAGMEDATGFAECAALVAKAIRGHHWPEAGLYYPQYQIFPYSASRAYRDGGARSPVMREAMKKLLVDVLDDRDRAEEHEKAPAGSFPGGEDPSFDLSTALGCITLMNIGEDLAEEAGVLPRFRQALTRGVGYLLNRRKKHKILDEASFGGAQGRPWAFAWEDGLFFSGAFEGMSFWRSRPYTVAMVLEALVKYRLAYEKHDAPVTAVPRLRLKKADGAWTLSVR